MAKETCWGQRTEDQTGKKKLKTKRKEETSFPKMRRIIKDIA